MRWRPDENNLYPVFLGAGGIYIGFGLLFQDFAASYLGFSPEWWVVSLIAAVAVFVLNVVGIRPTVRAQLGTTRWEIWLSFIGIGLAAVFAAVTAGRASKLAKVVTPETVAAPAP